MKKLLQLVLVACLMPIMSNAQSYLFEDFSTATGTTPPTGWTQTTVTGDPAIDLWHFDNPGAQTLNAPISDPAAIFDSDSYSNNSMAEDVLLTSPAFDATAATTLILEFDHFFEDGASGAYQVEVFNGTTWDTVLSGTLITANPQAESINISTSAAGVSNAQVRFRWIGDWSYWWIVDNINVVQPPADDIGIVSIDGLSDGCSLSATETITVSIQNFGTATQSSFPLGFLVDMGTPVIEMYSGTAIAPDSVETYTFTATADLSMVGPHTIGAATGLLTDADNLNDSASIVVEHLAAVTTPYLEDLETFTSTNLNGWVQSTNDDGDWVVDAGGTPSDSTGPVVDHTTGTSAGIYLFTESSGFSFNVNEIVSPCIDLSGVSAPGLEFWYHMRGATMGTLEVDIIAGGVTTNIWSLTGEQQLLQASPWKLASINLGAYTGMGPIQFVFRGIIGSSFESDMAIDDIAVVELPTVDLAATNIFAPSGLDCFSAAETVLVEITNMGLTTIDFAIDTATVTVDFSNASTVSLSAEVNMDTLAAGASMIVGVGSADLSLAGVYDMTAYAEIGGDINASNDTTLSSATSNPPIPAPYLEDFETFTPGNLMNGWSEGTGDLNWTVDANGTGSPNTGPDFDHTTGGAAGIYLYTEATGPAPGTTYELTSPCLDMSALVAPSLSFWYHMAGTDMGTLEVYVLADGIDTLVYSLSGPQQSSTSDDWKEAFINLVNFPDVIQLRFRGIRGADFTSDIAIDDINIGEAPACAPPSDILVTNIGEDSVVVTWVNGDSTLSNSLEYGIVGFMPGSGTSVAATSPSTINGLTPNTPYDVYLTSICANDTIVSGPIPFVTACPAGGVSGDSLVDAIMVPSLPFTAIGHTGGCYTDQIGQISPDVFYSVTTGACATSLTVTMCNSSSNFDTYIHLADSTGTIIEFNDDDANCTVAGTLSTLDSIVVTPNTQYYVVVEGWSDRSGVYEVTITENPGAIAVGVDAIADASCAGDSTGSIDISVMGGTAPYTFAWDNGATTEDLSNLPAGSYVGTITDSLGCVFVSSALTISEPSAISVTLDSLVNTNCSSDSLGSINITPSGGTAPYTYAWSTGDTTQNLVNIPAGTYQGTVIDANGCEDISPDLIVEADLADPTPDFTFVVDSTSGTVTFTNTSSDGTTYNWDFGDSTGVSTMESPVYTFNGVGSYDVTLMVMNECGTEMITQTVAIEVFIGINDLLSNSIAVYPNPSNGTFEVSFKGLNLASANLSVVSIDGKKVHSEMLENISGQFTHKVNLSDNVAKGIYVVQIHTAQGFATKRIRIQ